MAERGPSPTVDGPGGSPVPEGYGSLDEVSPARVGRGAREVPAHSAEARNGSTRQADGRATDGRLVDGSVVDGHVGDGRVVEGRGADGRRSNGRRSNGRGSNGRGSGGRRPEANGAPEVEVASRQSAEIDAAAVEAPVLASPVFEAPTAAPVRAEVSPSVVPARGRSSRRARPEQPRPEPPSTEPPTAAMSSAEVRASVAEGAPTLRRRPLPPQARRPIPGAPGGPPTLPGGLRAPNRNWDDTFVVEPEDEEEEEIRRRRWRRQKVRVMRSTSSRRLVRRLDTWTVFKMSLFFYLLGLAIIIVAGVILWNVATTFGTITSLQKSVRSLFDLTHFVLKPKPLLEYTAAGGGVLALLGTIVNTVAALLYNLISDVVGGIQIVVVTEPD